MILAIFRALHKSTDLFPLFPSKFKFYSLPKMFASLKNEQFKCLHYIDLLAVLEKGLDRALFLYIFMHEIRLSGVRASITVVYIRKFYKKVSFN